MTRACLGPPTRLTAPASPRLSWRCSTRRKLTGIVVARLDRPACALTVQEASWPWRGRPAGTFTADAGEVLRDDPANPMRTAPRQAGGRHPT